MNPLVWLLRMRRWLAHPPPASRVWLVVGVIALCLALAGAERLGLVPEGWQGSLRPGAAARP
ncbi:hypothetical protein V8J36_09880 [Frigidibacter sp. MR17.14]|uniref:hypothetical protein n=1 Tax=Frigidibacter sp. MR17.14 TaxID=3126509 RepID=UPI003012CBEF